MAVSSGDFLKFREREIRDIEKEMAIKATIKEAQESLRQEPYQVSLCHAQINSAAATHNYEKTKWLSGTTLRTA